jgi:preprotein translocase subunit Sec61beta
LKYNITNRILLPNEVEIVMYLCRHQIFQLELSSKKKNAPLPASSAGLLRFFEDETKGVKVKPEVILGVTGGLIGISLLIRILFPV